MVFNAHAVVLINEKCDCYQIMNNTEHYSLQITDVNVYNILTSFPILIQNYKEYCPNFYLKCAPNCNLYRTFRHLKVRNKAKCEKNNHSPMPINQ